MTVVHFENEEQRREMRNKLVRDAVATGIREEDAYIIVDILVKCKMDAYDAIQRTAKTAPEHLQGMIVYESLLHFSETIGAMKEQINEALGIATAIAVMSGVMLDAEAARQKGKPS